MQVDNSGGDGTEFYAALLAQADRWDAFVAAGVQMTLPHDDRRCVLRRRPGGSSVFMDNDRGVSWTRRGEHGGLR